MALLQSLLLNTNYYLRLFLFILFRRNLNQIKAGGSFNGIQLRKAVSYINDVQHIGTIILSLSS